MEGRQSAGSVIMVAGHDGLTWTATEQLDARRRAENAGTRAEDGGREANE